MTEPTPTPAPEPAPAPAPAPAPTPAPAPAATPEPSPTRILGDNGAAADTGKQVVPADWPADWRDKIAGEDKAYIKKLERYASPIEYAKAYRALEQRVGAGEVKFPPPPNATPEQMATWRKNSGIPEKPEDYKTELKDGAKISPETKPVIDKFLATAHAKNWSQAQVNDVLQSYAALEGEQTAQVAALDADYKTKSEDALRGEWGPDYRRHVNAVDNLLATMPEELSEVFINGRLADGHMVGADPRVIRWLHSLAMDYPSLVPGGSEAAASGEARLAEIRKFRQSNPDGYDKDRKMQTEELELLSRAQRKAPGRAA